MRQVLHCCVSHSQLFYFCKNVSRSLLTSSYPPIAMSSSKVAYILNPERSVPKSATQVKLRQTCDACQAIKTRCSRDRPCQRCQTQKIECHYSVSRRIGRPRRQAPPPSPASPSHIRRQDEKIPVTSEPSNETASIAQSSGAYTVDWSVVDIDVDSDSDRMMIDVCPA